MAVIPPTGTFDPALEAQRASSRRGLEDLIADVQRAEGRSREDVVTQLANFARQYQRGSEDLATALERGLRDLARSEERGLEDFGVSREGIIRTQQRGLADLFVARTRAGEDIDYAKRKSERQYGFLGNAQAQAINAAHDIRGGALAASAAKRASNQAFEFEPVQRTYERNIQDITSKEGRLNEDTSLGLAELARQQNRFTTDIGTQRSDLTFDVSRSGSRLGEDYASNVNLANTQYARGVEDRVTDLSRATREQSILESDITAQEFFDAAQRNPTIGSTPAPTTKKKRGK